MAIISGIICRNSTQKHFLIPPVLLDNLSSLRLPKSDGYIVAFDPSTSCTGIAAISLNRDFYALFDVRNDLQSKDNFFRDIFRFIYQLFATQRAPLIIHEHMPPQRYANGVALLELEGALKEWIKRIPGFDQSRVEKILPQSWKTFVVDPNKPGDYVKGKKKRRCDCKNLIAEDVTALYPLLDPYLRCTPAKDYDSFDAMGIIHGYLDYAYDEQGRPKICGLEEKTHTSLVAYRPLAPEILTQPNALYYGFNGCERALDMKYLIYNTRYNLNKNIRMATSNNKAVATVIPDKYVPALQLEFGFDYAPGSVCCAYMLRKGKLTAREQSFINEILPMQKLVYTAK